jgi:outer membrane protein assembly factor BamD
MVGHTYSSKKIRPDRDLANLREAFTAYEQLTVLYPSSSYAEEARTRIAALRDTLAEHEWLVAQFYYRNKRWQGALWRLEYLKENYPDYTRIAEVNSMVDEVNSRITEIEETYRKLLEERRQSQER